MFKARHSASSRRKVSTFGVGLDFVSYADVFNSIEGWRKSGRTSYIAVANPHSIYLAKEDSVMKAALAGAGLTVPDGIGAVIAATLLGYPNAGRVAGPTLTLKICDWGRPRGYRHFFCGGADGVAEKMAANLKCSFPGLLVAGCYSPPFPAMSEEEDQAATTMINDSKADLVWVGLGAPKQEKWMASHLGRVKCTAMIGVGAAFDFHSGVVPWAPRWVREAGCEWVYRTIREPKRVWPKAVDGVRLVISALSWRLSSRNGRGG